MSNPQIELIRREHPGLILETELAEQLGRSHSTIKRWRREGRISPPFYRDTGRTRIWLYDEQSIAAAKEIAATIQPGRPRANG